MIIKTLSRKGNDFKKAISYVDRNRDETEKSAQFDTNYRIYHNIIGNSKQEAIQAFKENYKYKPKRKNSNGMYHEILSFHRDDPVTQKAIEDIGQEYIRIRSTNSLVYGAIHTDKEHIHLHLIISSNEVASPKASRLTKKQFHEVRKDIEKYQQKHYPELTRSLVYVTKEKEKKCTPKQQHSSQQEKYIQLKKRLEEESKTQNRRRKVTDKERIFVYLYQSMERADTLEQFYENVKKQGLEIYQRKDKPTGIILNNRKYRFVTAIGKDKWRAFEKESERMERIQSAREQDKKQEREISNSREERLRKVREQGKNEDLGRKI